MRTQTQDCPFCGGEALMHLLRSTGSTGYFWHCCRCETRLAAPSAEVQLLESAESRGHLLEAINWQRFILTKQPNNFRARQALGDKQRLAALRKVMLSLRAELRELTQLEHAA